MNSRHSRPELAQLLQKALLSTSAAMTDCQVLYRNKPKPYFDILKNSNGTYNVMKKYIKDNSGDQQSPINGRISGLFFSASVGDYGNRPRSPSAFGDTRIHVPVNLLADSANLYFADFYCMQDSRHHYVTLVMTKPNTAEDNFCASYLIPLPFENNQFFTRSCGLFFSGEKKSYKVNSASSLLVEIFYTEDLNINDVLKNGGRIEYNVETFGKGKSSSRGLPKNTSCHVCTLYPTALPPDIYQRRNQQRAHSFSYLF